MSDVIQIRISPEDRDTLSRAAEHAHRSLSEFIRSNALERAHAVLARARREQVTVLPPQTFDALMASLADHPVSIPHLVKSTRRLAELDLDSLPDP